MKPTPKKQELVDSDNFINAVIAEITYEKEHEFSFQGKSTGKQDAIKFKFILDGYAEPKYSGWLKFNYAEKGNLYKKYISSLVEGAKPAMEFDVDQLHGMKVKILFTAPNEKERQYIDKIRPQELKIVPDPTFESIQEPF